MWELVQKAHDSTHNSKLYASRVRVTVPQLQNSEMPLARCSDASLTRTLRRAEEMRGRKEIDAEIAYFGCADPYPFRLYFE